MIKPDGVGRGLVQEIKTRVEAAGFKFVQSRFLIMPRALAEKLYAVHRDKPFYQGLVNFIVSGEVMVSIVEGEKAITGVRNLMGATDPREASPHTIRGDLRETNVINAEGIMKNIVHGSDSAESAAYEIPLFFSKEQDL
jgi:nucleoside-diphosphate kinase